MIRGHTGDQHALFAPGDLGGDLDDLGRRFAVSKNDFGKILAQGPVRVHQRETQVGDRSSLKGAQHFGAANPARAKLFQQHNRFGRCHGGDNATA